MSLDDDRKGLIERFLDESAAEADLERILGLLESDAEFRSEFAGALRMRGLLHSAHEADESYDRLAEVVQGCRGMSADAVARSVEVAVVDFQRGQVSDDLAVVVARVPG